MRSSSHGFYLVIGFKIRHNNTGPRGFKLQALQKGVIMQTNCLLQQYVLTGQNPVSSYCLMPPLRFALLGFFLIIQQHHAETNGDHRPLTKSLSINIGLQEKKVPRVFLFFFSLLEDLKPSSKVLSCSYHSAIQRVLDCFMSNNIQRPWTVGLQLQQRPQNKRQISKLSRLIPTVWAVALPNTNIKKRNKLFAFQLYKCFFFFFFSICHCNSGRCAT